MTAFERQRDTFLYRIHESILNGVDNETVVVEQPRYPTAEQMQTLF